MYISKNSLKMPKRWSESVNRRRTDNTMTKRRRTDNTMTKRRRTDNTMTKRQKNRQHNDQKTEEQTTQWPKEKRHRKRSIKYYTEN
jgi:hypothetical protein